MRNLSSSLRINRRHILVESDEENADKAITEYIGVLGWSKAAPVFTAHPKGVIVSINREMLTEVRAAFEIYSKSIKVLGVSGTFKGLNKRISN